jgi:excisionase family DNA binding protein
MPTSTDEECLLTQLLTPEEVQATLRLGRTRVYGMLASGELPAVRFGKSVRVRSADLEQWIASHTEPAMPDRRSAVVR